MQGEPLPAEDPAPSSGLSSFKLGNPSFEFVEFKFRIRRGQVSNSENKASNSGQVSNSDPSFRFGVSSPALGEPHREARQLVHEEAEHIYTYIYIYICCICLYMCLYLSLSLSLSLYIYIYIYTYCLKKLAGNITRSQSAAGRTLTPADGGLGI